MKIAFVPIDDRPVCYSLAQDLAAIDRSLELLLPPREWLGSLVKYADNEKILDWLSGLSGLDAVVISLDTIAYGGLISSRRCPECFEEIYERIEGLKRVLKILKAQGAKVYAFSSIMRISNNNINEEEKDYWSQWGKKIFRHSFTGLGAEEIPAEILTDYLSTRKRNFDINKVYLEWQKEGLFDTLVYSKDDCAEGGFNVDEARELEALGAFVKTGADEIPLSLLSRAVSGDVKIAPVFTEPDQKHLISNYEDISIENCVKGQIELAGCEVCAPQEADLLLFVNNFIDHQGEIVMGVPTEPFKAKCEKTFEPPSRPHLIADVRFANGSDNAFAGMLLQKDRFNENFYGYSAWNTSANTLGSLICAGKIKCLAQDYDEKAFKKLQLIRFLDDWAYQANVRQTMTKPDVAKVKEKMKPYEDKLLKLFGVRAKIDYKFPWSRLFEIEVEIELI